MIKQAFTTVIDQYDAVLMAVANSRRRFHAMAKPGGSTCNLDRDYWFKHGSWVLQLNTQPTAVKT